MSDGLPETSVSSDRLAFHRRRAIAASVLSLAFFSLAHIPFIKIAFPSDEGDNLLGGWLLCQGYVPYRDFFSQHTPFGFFYSALFELFFTRNWVVHRWSVALLGLVVLIYLQMRLLIARQWGLFYSVALFALLWPIYSVLYWGFMLLNDNLAAYACLLLFVLLLYAWQQPLGVTDYIIAGLASYVAVMSNPFTVFPVLVWLLAVGIGRWRQAASAKSSWRTTIYALAAGGGIPALCTVAYFAATHSLTDAWHSVVAFNQQVFVKYHDHKYFAQPVYQSDSPSFFWPYVHQISTALDLLSAAPWEFRARLSSLHVGWGNDWWVYFGLMGRAAIVGVSLILLGMRRPFLAVACYSFAAACLLRTNEGFHVQHFRQIELFCEIVLAVWCVAVIRRARFPLRCSACGVLGVLLFVQGVVTVKAVKAIRHHGIDWTLYARDERIVPHALRIEELLGDSGKLLCYPTDYQANYELGKLPASYFYACVPWTVERPQDRARIRENLECAAQARTVVCFGRFNDVWGHPMEYYAADVLDVLRRDYAEVIPDVYVARGQCNTAQSFLQSVNLPLEPIETVDLHWSDSIAVSDGGHPQLVFALSKPTFVHRVELQFVLANANNGRAFFQTYWMHTGVNFFGEAGRRRAAWLPTGPEVRTFSLPVESVIDRVRIDPDVQPCKIELRSIKLIVPGRTDNCAFRGSADSD